MYAKPSMPQIPLVGKDLRRNRRQYEQLTDFDRGPYNRPQRSRLVRRIGRHLGRSDMVVARCWQQWITEGRVYRRGGQDVPGTQMIGSCNQKSGHFGTNNVASIDSTPLTSFQTCAIKRKRLTEVGLRSRRPLRRFDPHHKCRLDPRLGV
ncbi:HTH_38 domain-containing protein [Trichonephila clavipes]|nr:HTH_38 domain-containing protein [Trichonephila clavipes]